MQLRYSCPLSVEDYINKQAWRQATLRCCPLHVTGGCGFARHGTYIRRSPPGTRIARWYCRRGHCTFSLLPDCLASRLPGTLVEVESVVTEVEQASSLEAACSQLRLDIELPGVLRWVRRRVKAVHVSLNTLKGLMPEHFGACEPTLVSFTRHLGVDAALPTLREIAARYLLWLPGPLGLLPRSAPCGGAGHRTQQPAGPDPPSLLR